MIFRKHFTATLLLEPIWTFGKYFLYIFSQAYDFINILHNISNRQIGFYFLENFEECWLTWSAQYVC